MLDKKELIICDECSNVVNDGKTLLPGYLAIDNQVITQSVSDDPNNNNPRLDLLKNRIEDEDGNTLFKSTLITLKDVNPKELKDGDFCNTNCAIKFSKQDTKIVEGKLDK